MQIYELPLFEIMLILFTLVNLANLPKTHVQPKLKANPLISNQLAIEHSVISDLNKALRIASISKFCNLFISKINPLKIPNSIIALFRSQSLQFINFNCCINLNFKNLYFSGELCWYSSSLRHCSWPKTRKPCTSWLRQS